MVKLFVFGFSYKTYETTLKSLFDPYGTVHSVYIASDEKTGKKLNFGFIEMVETSAAEKAILELDGSDLHSRKISVRIADKKNNIKEAQEKANGKVDLISQTPQSIVKKKRPRIIK